MKIALVHDCLFPVQGYGGTERLVWWMAKGLTALGFEVFCFVRPGSISPYGKVVPTDFTLSVENQGPSVDLYHWFAPPPREPEFPYLATIGGNGKPGEVFSRNTVFVSRNHAERHGSQSFVYNGVDPDDYLFSPQKSKGLLFLAKASWRVKNVKGAMRIARAAGVPLHILGGSRVWLPHFRGVHWEGVLGGEAKAKWIATAQGLLFPVEWDEPFGLAVVESLMSGTPVIASRRGSLPELVSPDVGVLADSHQAMIEAVPRLKDFSAERCREWAREKFDYRKMVGQYVERYEQVLSGAALNPQAPRAIGNPGQLIPLS